MQSIEMGEGAGYRNPLILDIDETYMNLEKIDLNLLVVFNHLMVEKRVSAVARKLGLTQPTVSSSLNRLRKLLNDELFVRTAKGMEPTAFALHIAEPIAYALSSIQQTLSEQEKFDPARSTRRFTIWLNDIGEINFLPQLLHVFRRLAPGISISTLRSAVNTLQEAMESGEVDVAMGLLPQLKAGYFQRRLFKQRYVCMFRAGHPLDKGSITVEEFCAAEHLVVMPPASGHAQVNESIERRGYRRKVRLVVPHYVPVGHILSQGLDLIATVPESYARQCVEPFGMTYVDHPLDLPAIVINVFWHAKFHRDPANKWLRTVIFDTFSDNGGVHNLHLP